MSNIPIYLKDDAGEPDPQDAVYYVLTRTGLYLNRQTPFFRSSVPAPAWPAHLAAHEPQLDYGLPPIPQADIERIVGLFDLVYRRGGSEAICLLGWRETDGGRYEVVVPPQTCTPLSSWGGSRCVGHVRYETPATDPGLRIVGSVHSHGPVMAHMSWMDIEDQRHRAGLHVVVGCVDDEREPPDLHACMVVDGFAFEIDNPLDLFEAYKRRQPEDVPREWLAQVRIEPWRPASGGKLLPTTTAESRSGHRRSAVRAPFRRPDTAHTPEQEQEEPE